jgi:two-component sensor histidine kinase
MRSFKLKKDNKRLESKVEERTQSLERVLDEKNMLLSEKNLLLTEIHHRVKNNLQVINGLLELRKETFRDKKYKAAFSEGQSSIISIAMIHELLYQNENFGSLRFTIIAKNITNSISQLFATQKRQIDFEFGNSDIALNVDTAVPLGLILNELLTNAYKYLPLNGENKVVIDLLDLENGHYQFIFQDNGPGLNADIDLNNVTSIGLSIVKRLVTQLEGKMHYEYNNGAKFVITFPNLTEVV